MMVELDQATMLPMNFYSYYLDLEKANATGTPTWELLQDYNAEYGLSDVSPRSMKQLADRLLTDADLASQFTWNMHSRFGDKPTAEEVAKLDAKIKARPFGAIASGN